MDVALLGVVTSLAGLIFGYFGFKRGQNSEIDRMKNNYKEEGELGGTLRTDIQYIKRRSEETLMELKDIGKTISQISDRLTRAEESLKAAHRRIDTICEDCKEIQRAKRTQGGV